MPKPRHHYGKPRSTGRPISFTPSKHGKRIKRTYSDSNPKPNPLDSKATRQRLHERNKEAFDRMKQTLLNNPDLRGKYVVIIDEKVVDSDANNNVLLNRVNAKYGYVPLYLGKVIEGKRYVELPILE